MELLCRRFDRLRGGMTGNDSAPHLDQGELDRDQGRLDKQTQKVERDEAAENVQDVSDIGISMPKPISQGLMMLSIT